MPRPIFVFKCNGTDDVLSIHLHNPGFFKFFQIKPGQLVWPKIQPPNFLTGSTLDRV